MTEPEQKTLDLLLPDCVKDVSRECRRAPVGAELIIRDAEGRGRDRTRCGQVDGVAESALRIQLRVDDETKAVFRFQFAAGTDAESLPPLSELTLGRWSRSLRSALTRAGGESRADAFSTLLKVTQTISSSLNVKEVLHRIVFEALLLFEAKICSLHLLNEEGAELEIETVYGSSLEYIQKPNVPVEGTVLGGVVRNREIVRVPDVQVEQRYLHRDLAQREGVRSLIAAPLIFQDQALGVLAVYSRHVREWTDEEASWLSALAGQSAVALRNAHLVEQIVRLEESVRHLDRLSVLGELAAGVAHEIRNPLAILSMLAHSLKEELPEDDAHGRDIRLIAEKAEQMNVTLEEMTKLARAKPPELAPTSVNQVVRDTLHLLAPRLRASHHRLNLDLDEDDPHAMADGGRLAQVLLNLFLNASEALGRGGEITIAVQRDGGRVRLSIADTGPGIPEEIRHRLFRPFVTGRREGTGLGLSIVKRIVEDHRGTIDYETGSSGTVFRIRLPAAEVDSAAG